MVKLLRSICIRVWIPDPTRLIQFLKWYSGLGQVQTCWLGYVLDLYTAHACTRGKHPARGGYKSLEYPSSSGRARFDFCQTRTWSDRKLQPWFVHEPEYNQEYESEKHEPVEQLRIQHDVCLLFNTAIDVVYMDNPLYLSTVIPKNYSNIMCFARTCRYTYTIESSDWGWVWSW